MHLLPCTLDFACKDSEMESSSAAQGRAACIGKVRTNQGGSNGCSWLVQCSWIHF